MLIHGNCHCGNISFRLDWQPEPLEIPARACSCSFCTRHGGVWTACPDGDLVIEIRDSARVSNYAFGTRTADFHVCSQCGVVPVVTSRIDGRLYAVVNVNTLNNVDASMLKRAQVSFDAEDERSRLQRRAKHWIGKVRFGPLEA
ncbi:MAG: hypothetical protein KF778_13665 [Rhodocyclaceae bacterium]|nr:hypothetical protein [Rhodocyclaceae bacterium]MBX3669444.1 hypothetical protein [Rhodocyclaceae bacterium]